MSTETLYVYAVMRASDPADLTFAAVDQPDAAPRHLDCGPIKVIASPIENDEVLSTRRNMLTHAKALETLMVGGPILPMRFGLVAANADGILSTVENHASRLVGLLDDLEGCVEMGVKIVWDRAAAMREIVAETPSLAETYQRLQTRDERETHYERIELGRRVEAAMRTKREAEAAAYDARLSAIARDRALQEPDDELMVLKADYLVEHAQEPEMAAALEAIEADAPERLSISYVGPSPAYNFVNLQLDWRANAPVDAGGPSIAR